MIVFDDIHRICSSHSTNDNDYTDVVSAARRRLSALVTRAVSRLRRRRRRSGDGGGLDTVVIGISTDDEEESGSVVLANEGITNNSADHRRRRLDLELISSGVLDRVIDLKNPTFAQRFARLKRAGGPGEFLLNSLSASESERDEARLWLAGRMGGKSRGGMDVILRKLVLVSSSRSDAARGSLVRVLFLWCK